MIFLLFYPYHFSKIRAKYANKFIKKLNSDKKLKDVNKYYLNLDHQKDASFHQPRLLYMICLIFTYNI